jgi:L-amino acid N-acyltransferase YncA
MTVPSARELAECSLERQHPLTRMWVDDATRVDLLTKQHEQLDVLLATDLEIAEARVERLAPGHPAETMLNRWVPVGDDLHAMLSMRYEGMDPAKPFVDATPLTRPLQAGDLPALAAAAADAYGRYRPQYLRLWSAEPVGWLPGTGLDRRFLGAPIELLQPRDVPPGLALTPAQSLAHYDEAQHAYAAVVLEHPDHSGQSTLQDRENLEETVEAGLLFDITVDGKWAGYSAAMDSGQDTLGLPAYVVRELILAPEFRGRGFGSHISNLLAEALPDHSRILIGTIHAANRGSIQSAIRAGRFDLGGWLQYRLSGR